MIYVSIYVVERCYGGAEEGGWWYDWYSLEDSFGYIDENVAHEKAQEVSDILNQRNEDEHDQRVDNTANMPQGDSPWLDTEGYIPTNWSDGGIRTVVVESEKGSRMETCRPHYE